MQQCGLAVRNGSCQAAGGRGQQNHEKQPQELKHSHVWEHSAGSNAHTEPKAAILQGGGSDL